MQIETLPNDVSPNKMFCQKKKKVLFKKKKFSQKREQKKKFHQKHKNPSKTWHRHLSGNPLVIKYTDRCTNSGQINSNTALLLVLIAYWIIGDCGIS